MLGGKADVGIWKEQYGIGLAGFEVELEKSSSEFWV